MRGKLHILLENVDIPNLMVDPRQSNIVESSVEVCHNEDYVLSKRPKKDDNVAPVKKGSHSRANGRIRKGARSPLLIERETTSTETSTYGGPEKVNSSKFPIFQKKLYALYLFAKFMWPIL